MNKKITPKSIIPFFSIMGATGAIFYFVVFVILHFLNQDISPVTNYVSEYAIGSYGNLFRISLFVHGLSNIFTSAALAYYFRQSRAGVSGAILFGVASFGMILGAIFSMDPSGALRSTAGTIHQLAAFGSFLVETVALALFGSIFKNIPAWKSFGTVTMSIVVVNIILLSWLIVSIATKGMLGIAERGAILTFLLWEILAAVYLKNLNEETSGAEI